jgi:hypothetical protein
MVRIIDSKIFHYKSRVIIHVPMKLARDSAFPFGDGSEDVTIEVRGKTLIIKKRR